jgi:hypothetical protein
MFTLPPFGLNAGGRPVGDAELAAVQGPNNAIALGHSGSLGLRPASCFPTTRIWNPAVRFPVSMV